MKRLTVIASCLLVVAFLLNINSIFKYRITEVQGAPYEETQITEDIWEDRSNQLELRPSIQSHSVSGNLSDIQLSFNSTTGLDEEGKEVSDEENKKVFFFGKTDPKSGEEIVTDSWGDWIGDVNGGTSNVGSNTGSYVDSDFTSGTSSDYSSPSDPLEVTYERFLQGE